MRRKGKGTRHATGRRASGSRLHDAIAPAFRLQAPTKQAAAIQKNFGLILDRGFLSSAEEREAHLSSFLNIFLSSAMASLLGPAGGFDIPSFDPSFPPPFPCLRKGRCLVGVDEPSP
jgi:hypothetical protein